MSDPIRVLFVSLSLSGGGAERFVSLLLQHLPRPRFAPSLCVLRRDLVYPLPSDVPVSSLEKHRPLDTPLAVARLRRVIRELNPSVVVSSVSQTARFVGAALWTLPRTARPPWVARIGGNPVAEGGVLLRRANLAAYRLASRVVANSGGLSAAMGRCYPALTARLGTLYNPVDVDEVERLSAQAEPLETDDRGARRVVFVGRMSHEKRVDLLLDAFAGIDPALRAELWLLGDGPLRPTVLRRLSHPALSGRVHAPGFVENPYAHIARAAVVVLSSDHEGLPNVLIEAQALGIPVVSTDCDFGPREIVADEETGLLVPSGDAPALRRAIVRMLTEPETHERFAVGARERARRLFGLSSTLSGWENLLVELAETRGAGVG